MLRPVRATPRYCYYYYYYYGLFILRYKTNVLIIIIIFFVILGTYDPKGVLKITGKKYENRYEISIGAVISR